MAPGGATYEFQESCLAFRSHAVGQLHPSSGPFISQSAHYKKRQDFDGDGGWNAAAAVRREKRRVSRRRPATAITAWQRRCCHLSSGVIGQAWKKCCNSGI